MPKRKKKRSDKERLAFLADRMAVMLVMLRKRHGDDWNPFLGRAMWAEEDSLAAEIRSWPEFTEAKEIVRIFVRRLDSE